jgi:hypothetical protein
LHNKILLIFPILDLVGIATAATGLALRLVSTERGFSIAGARQNEQDITLSEMRP